MPSGYQNRILELDRIKQNASEQLEKMTIKISIIEAHLKHLLEEGTVGETSENQEIEELKRQLVAMKNQSLIFRRKEIDAVTRKKCLLRNQSKVHGAKAKLQVENSSVSSQCDIEAQLNSLNLTKLGDENENQKTLVVEREKKQIDGSLEKRPIQHEQNYSSSFLAVGNNNVNVADNENKLKLLNLLQKESNTQSILASPTNTVTAIISKADDDNNRNSLITPSPDGDNNREASDFVEDAECCNKSFQSNTSIISVKDEEFVPPSLPPKEEWENPHLWIRPTSFGNMKFTAIKTSPPIDWGDADASLFSRSRSQSEDRASLKPQDRGMHCKGRSRVKWVQEMNDFGMPMNDFKAEQQEHSNDSTSDSQREKPFSPELYQYAFSTKTKGLNKPARESRAVGDKFRKWISQPRPNKNAQSANDRLCKKVGNNNLNSELKRNTVVGDKYRTWINQPRPHKNAQSANDRLCKKAGNNNLNSELKQNTVVKPNKIAAVRTGAEMRKKMLVAAMYKPKSDHFVTPQSPAMPSNEVECVCLRPLKMIICNCGYWFVGRLRTICPIHPQDFYLLDVDECRECNSVFLKEYDMTEEELGENYRNPLIS